MIKKIFLFSLVFFLSFQVIIDTDFGWHLRVGEYISNTRSIPHTDLFSFSLPNYPYVYHSWLAEVLIFTSYKLSGFWGVSILYALILTAGLAFVYFSCRILSKGQVLPLFFLWSVPIAHAVFGGRVRVFGFLFTSVLYFLYLKFFKTKSRWVWLMPLVFLLWANLHGSFILGIGILIILITLHLTQTKIKKAQILRLTKIFSACILATFINPYYLRIWKQAFLMTKNSYIDLAGINPDWHSLIYPGSGGWIIALFVSALVLGVFFLKTKIDIYQKLLLFLFFLLSLFSTRFLIGLFVLAIPVANYLLVAIKKRLNNQVLRSLTVRIARSSVLLILTLMAFGNLVNMSFAYKSSENYSQYLRRKTPPDTQFAAWPYQANVFLNEKFFGTRILNEANWGGYMLFLNPQTKVFYYGAMDNFIVNNRSFVHDYFEIVHAGPRWRQLLDQFNINIVFLPSTYPLIRLLENNPQWTKVYQDPYSVIFLRNTDHFSLSSL